MCNLCKTKPVYEFTNKRKICKTCFIRYFQKKVLYTIRKFSMIKRGDKIYYKKSGDFKGVVLKHVLEMISSKSDVILITTKSNKTKATKIALADNIDSVSEEIINALIKGKLKKLKMSPYEGKMIKPLYLFTDKEISLYAKLRGLKVNKEKLVVSSGASGFVNRMEDKHPEIKRAIVNSFLELNR